MANNVILNCFRNCGRGPRQSFHLSLNKFLLWPVCTVFDILVFPQLATTPVTSRVRSWTWLLVARRFRPASGRDFLLFCSCRIVPTAWSQTQLLTDAGQVSGPQTQRSRFPGCRGWLLSAGRHGVRTICIWARGSTRCIRSPGRQMRSHDQASLLGRRRRGQDGRVLPLPLPPACGRHVHCSAALAAARPERRLTAGSGRDPALGRARRLSPQDGRPSTEHRAPSTEHRAPSTDSAAGPASLSGPRQHGSRVPPLQPCPHGGQGHIFHTSLTMPWPPSHQKVHCSVLLLIYLLCTRCWEIGHSYG
ncbi:PREDICTED: uncharacterized protein LOC102020970 [Chinchilla lanigera]|uniref:uncharacterized protein LOC102020970 n=1 Tax=Chinchilla lanigera TaxID=34839 RepID=UPI0006982AC3|nr:PREDICTED: uncharacterized protein LOC102020970 [Chinchilla lanigera]XP_013367018.1 PREDICTED: uncharacterized protein LOC102020970 [Chinchilla lanigera]XP_013367023.1 PREDICTED: uncharacterized protein LOC102020970 [Chinchilla lanigera]